MASAPDWDLYQSLRAVLRAGSLSAAARRLGLSQPTLGRHVEQLEQSLGLPLFTRSPQGLKPTDFALRLAPYLEAMASAAEAALREASGEAEAVSGVVRVTASEVIGIEVLPAMLARFRERHPGVIIELAPSNAMDDLLRRDSDIAVRMTRPSQGALVAKRIGVTALGLHGHRRYLEAHGTPADLAALADHPLIGFDRNPVPVEGARIGGRVPTREMFAFRTDSDLAQLAALRAGLGLAVCQYGVARRDPDLIPVLPGLVGFEIETWVVMHEDLKTSRRMRLMFDHLVAELGLYIAGAQAPHAGGETDR